jgi:hypothetical protein
LCFLTNEIFSTLIQILDKNQNIQKYFPLSNFGNSLYCLIISKLILEKWMMKIWFETFISIFWYIYMRSNSGRRWVTFLSLFWGNYWINIFENLSRKNQRIFCRFFFCGLGKWFSWVFGHAMIRLSVNFVLKHVLVSISHVASSWFSSLFGQLLKHSPNWCHNISESIMNHWISSFMFFDIK